MEPKAFIFDLDGVLTDTAEYHYQAWKILCERLGLRFDRKDNERLKGVSRIRSFEIILEINNALDRFSEEEKEEKANEKNEAYVQLIKKITPKDVLPNIFGFLDEAKRRGIKLAVASASRNANTVLEGLQIKDFFDYIADANKIKKSKPDPEVFLDCCSHLNIDPKECVGFEDAQAGIEAIKKAGMFAVGIGVEITSIHPDLALVSTEELECNIVLNSWGNYSK